MPKIGRVNRCRGCADSCTYSLSDFCLVPLSLEFFHPEKQSQRKEKGTKISLLRHKTQMRQTAGWMHRFQTFICGNGLGEI